MVEINATKGLKLTPTTAPSAEKGIMYYDSASDAIKVSTNGSSFENLGDATPALIQAGLNKVSNLAVRDVISSKGGFDGFAENYISAGGRKGSVGGTTDAFFDTNKYVNYKRTPLDTIPGGVLYNPNAMVNPNNAFDNNTGTAATLSASFAVGAVLGKTWTTGLDIAKVYVKAQTTHTIPQDTYNAYLGFEWYDGTNWYPGATLVNIQVPPYPGSTFNYEGYTTFSQSGVKGIRVNISQNGAGFGAIATAYVWEIGIYTGLTVIEHAIPSGSFSSTISKSIGIPYIADWETGDNIQYKLTNATEDSGWLDYNTVKSFTAFTSQPTKLIVQLIPKSSNATSGYPSINGFYIKEM